MINLVNAEMLVSDAGVEYDSAIADAFENQTSVKIIVELKDDSGIIVEGTKQERMTLMNQKDEWFKPKIEEVLSSLPEDSFDLLRKSSNGFSGTIDEKGFEILVNNSLVSAIYMDVEVQATENGTENEPRKVNRVAQNLKWIWFSIGIILIVLLLIKKKK